MGLRPVWGLGQCGAQAGVDDSAENTVNIFLDSFIFDNLNYIFLKNPNR